MAVRLEFGNVATNCGLERWSDGYVGVFKNGTFNFCWEMGLAANVRQGADIRQMLYLVRFDERLRVRAVGALNVDVRGLSHFDPECDLIEDARLFDNGKELIIVTNYVPGGGEPGSWPKQSLARPLIGVLDPVTEAATLFPVSIAGVRSPQKNWIPLGQNGELFLQYSVHPHRILRADPHSGCCEDAWSARSDLGAFLAEGDLKGGTPLIFIDGKLLGACHSWVLNKDAEREYVTFFYTTRADPPYSVMAISRPVKILMPDRVQYLIGMVADTANDSVVVSYGVNDCDNYFVRVRLGDIYRLLQPVSCAGKT